MKSELVQSFFLSFFCSQSPPNFAEHHSSTPSSPSPHRRATFTVGSPSSCSSPSPPCTPHSFGSPMTPPKVPSNQSPAVVIPGQLHRRSPSARCSSPKSQPSPPMLVPQKSSLPSPPLANQPVRKISTGRCPSPKGERPASVRKRAASISAVSPKTQKDVAKLGSRPNQIGDTPLTAAAKAISTVLQEPPALLSNAAEQTLARPVRGTIQRAMSNIEPLTAARPQNTSPILTALARQTNAGLPGIQFGQIQEGSENKQIIRVHSSPAILAVGLPRNKSYLSPQGFQFPTTGTPALTSPFKRHSGSGYQALRQHSASENPPVSASPPLPTIPGSPSKLSNYKEREDDTEMKPLRGLFTFGSSTPPSTVLGGDFLPFNSLPSTRASQGSGLKLDSGENPAVINQGKPVILVNI